MNALWLLQCCRYGAEARALHSWQYAPNKCKWAGCRSAISILFFQTLVPHFPPIPSLHAVLGGYTQQSHSAIMKLLAHFPTPFCHTPATVKYTSNPTIKSVCSQHGHAIGRPIMETEIYFWDRLCVWGIVPDLMAEREKLWRWVVQWHWPHSTAHTLHHISAMEH